MFSSVFLDVLWVVPRVFLFLFHIFLGSGVFGPGLGVCQVLFR